jgi:hypothetical protein
VVIVYNDFNVAQLLANAAMDTSEEVAGDKDVVCNRGGVLEL